MSSRYEIGKSIIYNCPALLMPQSFVEQVGGARQIVPLRGLTDEQSKFIADACNAALKLLHK